MKKSLIIICSIIIVSVVFGQSRFSGIDEKGVGQHLRDIDRRLDSLTARIEQLEKKLNLTSEPRPIKDSSKYADKFKLPLKIGQIAFLGPDQTILVEEIKASGDIVGQLILQTAPQQEATLVRITGILPNDIIKLPSNSSFLHIKIKRPLEVINKTDFYNAVGTKLTEFTLMAQ